MRKIPQIALLVLICLFFLPLIPANAISEAQTDYISKNCSSLRQSISSLRRSDASTRHYLSDVYTKVLINFMAPLNLRLVKNDIPNTDLTSSQASFASARTTFNEDYVSYSKSLEELEYFDCAKNPSAFYEKLIVVRSRRSKLEKDVENLESLIVSHKKSVEKLKESL